VSARSNPRPAAYRQQRESEEPQGPTLRVRLQEPGVIRITTGKESVHEAFYKLDLAYRQRNWTLHHRHKVMPEPAVVGLLLLAVFVLLVCVFSAAGK
jgi:hypothetical protein